MIKYYIKRIKDGIKNLIWWIKPIYEDRQWDFGYILELESKKIDRMIEWWSIDKNRIAENDEQILKELRFYKHLINLLYDDGCQYTTFINNSPFKNSEDNTNKFVGIPRITFDHYVNTKNLHRYLPNIDLSNVENSNSIIRSSLYSAKLWHIYNRYRELKLKNWWN